jgi:hypothetical protein
MKMRLICLQAVGIALETRRIDVFEKAILQAVSRNISV